MKKSNKGYGFPLRQESFPIPEEIVRAEYDEFMDHFQHLMNLKMKDEMMSDEERTSPDTYGCDCIFLDTFVTPAMEWEFALIARDFLMHEFENSKEHEMIQYLGTDCGDHWPERLFQRYILNMMMNAVNFGSSYAKNLFLYLHKVYYKKEYKQLKRFSTLSSGELIALAKSERGTSPSAMARILTIARMQGIDIGPDCNFVYLYLNDYNEELQEDDGYNWDLMDTTREIYDECLEEIRRMFDEDEMHRMYFKCGEFLGNALLSQGFIDDYVMLCNDDQGVEDRLAKTLAVLKKTYKKKKEFTKEELIFYAQVYEVIGALTSNASDMDTILMDVLYGEKQLTNPEEYHFTFKPVEVPQGRGDLPNVKKDEKITTKTELIESPRYKEETLIAEIDALRRKIHQQESDIKALKADLAGSRKLSDENVKLREQLDQEHKELAALREHVYHMTEEDEAREIISPEEMKDYLQTLRIIMIGGHSNWRQKMKQEFPDWIYIEPSVSGALDASVVDKADHVYFFTDTISHTTYYKYINVIREHDVEFGYIHGVNIENTVRKLYRDLKK